MEIKYLNFEKPLETIQKQIESLKNQKRIQLVDNQAKIVQLQQKLSEQTKEIFSSLTAWQKVQLARHPDRPHSLDYIEKLFEEFLELHGDGIFGDDPAVVAGLGKFEGISVAIIGQQKGRETKDNLRRNFGMAHPEGYRKALRVMKMAEKFGFPVITLVDTPGAHPDLSAEERGQALAIAVNLREMACLKAPILTLIIGEGGSGGALGIAVGDRVLMQEYAIYSVISPEGCASILWKTQSAVEEAARSLKLTSGELREMGLIDEVVPEPLGGAHRDWNKALETTREAVRKHLTELKTIKINELVDLRYQKYRKMGVFLEKESE